MQVTKHAQVYSSKTLNKGFIRIEFNTTTIPLKIKVLGFKRKFFLILLLCFYFQKSSLSFLFSKNLSSDFTLTYKFLSFKFIFYSIGFCKRVLQEKVCGLLITQILFHCCYAISGLEECIGELCTPCGCNPLVEGSIVDWEILHSGEGGDVEQWLEPRNKSSCLRLLSCLYLLSIYTLHNKIAITRLKLLSRGITRRSSEPFTGNSASSLV